MLQKKLKGNRYYSKGAFDEAIQTYMECLMGMDFKCDEAVYPRFSYFTTYSPKTELLMRSKSLV